MRQLNLVVPGLCGPLTDLDELDSQPALRDLIKILSRADRQQDIGNSFHGVLAEQFGLDASLPVSSAAFHMLAHGMPPGEANWLHADPVHLQADIDQAFLRDAESLDLDDAESQLLLSLINQHFNDDGLELLSVNGRHWFLEARDKTEIETTALYDVIGRNINFFMPKGNDHLYWKRFLNESQMLFHQSEVNEARAVRGLLPINSLWLWGEGTLPVAGKSQNTHVFTDNTLCRGMAMHHSVECSGLNAIADLSVDNEQSLVVLDDLYNISCYGDKHVWLEKFDLLYEHHLQPVIQYAMSNRVPLYLYPCNGVRYRLTAGNRLRWFRRGQVKDHMQSYDT